jgi:DNA-binding NarL/FixJ family response regulator
MKKVVISIQNSLLAEAITNSLSGSGEFLPHRVIVDNSNSLAVDCRTVSADILLAEVSYDPGTTLKTRIEEIKSIRKVSPDCKIVLLCDENSAPDIARSICNAKKDGVIDAFFYTSVSSTYLLDALDAL